MAGIVAIVLPVNGLADLVESWFRGGLCTCSDGKPGVVLQHTVSKFEKVWRRFPVKFSSDPYELRVRRPPMLLSHVRIIDIEAAPSGKFESLTFKNLKLSRCTFFCAKPCRLNDIGNERRQHGCKNTLSFLLFRFADLRDDRRVERQAERFCNGRKMQK